MLYLVCPAAPRKQFLAGFTDLVRPALLQAVDTKGYAMTTFDPPAQSPDPLPCPHCLAVKAAAKAREAELIRWGIHLALEAALSAKKARSIPASMMPTTGTP
jgi:glutaredoxin